MNKRLLIATHSTFAEGIKNAIELIAGKQDYVYTLCAYTNNISEVETPVKEFISSLKENEELIVATDILGGSVNNEFMKYLTNQNLHLISGMNLPLLIELIMNIESNDTKKSILSAIEISKSQIQYCNSLIESQEKSTETF